MTTKEQSIQKMMEKVFKYCKGGICPYCSHVIFQGKTITEKTEIITKCDFCGGKLN
jgi:hypothetical protein